MWDDVLPHLSRSRFVVAPALRGCGLSPAAPSATMDEMAADVLWMMDRLNLRAADVCGLSMGGYVAFAMMRQSPAHVTSLILADTRSQADTAEQKAGRAALAKKVMEEGIAAAVEAFLPRLLPADAAESIRDRVRAQAASIPREGAAAALHGLAARPDAGPQLAGLSLPVLTVCGERDVVSPPAEMRDLASRIPGAKYVEIAGAGHLTPMERPAEFAGVVDSFLPLERANGKG
jgi:pimeloyl-ACP methyl ester carboxylesterase